MGEDRWYLGIWYKKIIHERAYVWVSNRNKPLRGSKGSLEISDYDLVLMSQSGNNTRPIWSTDWRKGDERSPVVAMLQDSGNFVLRYSNTKRSGDYSWQSFDYPTDTLLPGMILGRTSERVHAESYLTSWKTLDDPSYGDFVLRLETTGNPRISIKMMDTGFSVFLSEPWNGLTSGRIADLFKLRQDGEDVTFFLATNNVSSYSRLLMESSGIASYLAWNESTSTWDTAWESTTYLCDIFNYCGSNSYCDRNVSSSLCTCIPGFEQSDSNMTIGDGCRRSTPLNCASDTFIGLENMSYPYTVKKPVDYGSMDLKRCGSLCVADCSCRAFALINNSLHMGSSNCFVWREDLAHLRRYADGGGLDILVKISGKKKKNGRALVIGLSIGIPALALFALAVFCLLKKKHNQAKASAAAASAAAAREVELAGYQITGPSGTIMSGQTIDFGIVQRATGNFSDSNKLGKGGFGVVYKGVLPDGKEIAVKKLMDMSTQGTAEFETEVTVIASLQHINLVRLLGWSVHQQEKVLIYEFLENGSLDYHLFVKNKSCELNWQTRFNIIKGIAKGIKYLQEESQLKVVHRDLKISNVLLDKDMVAKVSDFGLARIFESSENEAITAKHVGTFGYMSPEYAEGGIYSMKSDIYSFGVMVLEIVSGKQNTKFSYVESDTNFLTHVWQKWEQGNWQDLVDPIIRDSSPDYSHEWLRCIIIGLLCVQQLADDRPVMSHAVALLENEIIETRSPKPPGFFVETNRSDLPSFTTGESSIAHDYSVMSYPTN
ncbi:unnamed protein product [Microthlaspi erraticum]|uniref:Receptor-like serine/threonine-protein kinase n=1 Tax=Microthlaspi erraticum TaxID=1685480 RepID=A0A6D2IAB2_9BRAS|nr:unnamed protein product [Microthlaspi erraticum]